jgi:2-polyprenyl-6-methoxyphenol hydroxylase-like FAD-dependent oxidoreductase
MALLPQLQAAHIDTRKFSFVDAQGTPIRVITPGALFGEESSRDIELPRGTLTSLLYGLTRNGAIRYRFSDSIAELKDDGAGVDVRFKSGERGRFDIVVGADGLHSNTRGLVFGPEEQFIRYLGRCFNLFSMPNYAGFSHEGIIYAEPGRMACIYAVGDRDTVYAMLTFISDEAPSFSHRDIDEQRKWTAEAFANSSGWEIPRLVEGMQHDDDLFFDTVSQIHMPRWSSGRVVLVGDAAHAPSFISGQGTSIALVGAYILAEELATHADPAEAFASYERTARPFMEANQALATSGGPILFPRTQEELDLRNRALAAGESPADGGDRAAKQRQIHTSLKLPNYDDAGQMAH